MRPLGVPLKKKDDKKAESTHITKTPGTTESDHRFSARLQELRVAPLLEVLLVPGVGARKKARGLGVWCGLFWGCFWCDGFDVWLCLVCVMDLVWLCFGLCVMVSVFVCVCVVIDLVLCCARLFFGCLFLFFFLFLEGVGLRNAGLAQTLSHRDMDRRF